MIVLDTNVVSELIKYSPEPAVRDWSKALTIPVFITAVTVAEMRAGVALLPDGKRKREVRAGAEKLIAGYYTFDSILPFDAGCTEQYAQVIAARQKSGEPIGVADAQIAAICLANGFALATRNEKDFAETGVEVINPWGAE